MTDHANLYGKHGIRALAGWLARGHCVLGSHGRLFVSHDYVVGPDVRAVPYLVFGNDAVYANPLTHNDGFTVVTHALRLLGDNRLLTRRPLPYQDLNGQMHRSANEYCLGGVVLDPTPYPIMLAGPLTLLAFQSEYLRDPEKTLEQFRNYGIVAP